MLRLTPLIALVSIVTVGCDQSPVDPPIADTEDTTALLSAQGATVTSVPVSGTTDLCGYDLVDYEGTFQVVVRQAIDETGNKRSHVLEPFQFRLRGVGQTAGEVWNGWIKSAYAANYIGEPAFDLEGDAGSFNLVQQTKWVGSGQAPDFVTTFRGNLTINGNGDLVLFRVDFDNACD